MANKNDAIPDRIRIKKPEIELLTKIWSKRIRLEIRTTNKNGVKSKSDLKIELLTKTRSNRDLSLEIELLTKMASNRNLS